MARRPSSTTRSASAAPTSPLPSPEPEPLPSLPSVPTEQDAPVAPEEIDVTVTDSLTARPLRQQGGNGKSSVGVARTVPAVPPPPAQAPAQPRPAQAPPP